MQNRSFIIFTLSLCLGVVLTSCRSFYPTYSGNELIPATDYSNLKNWAAHPELTDPADRIPGQEEGSDQSTLPADVFFIHPTIYIKYRGNHKWNASLDDEKMNTAVDESTILFQASAFNQAGRVFAPRYRQAHLYAYFTDDKEAARQAFKIAYKDVKDAFEYYLKHYNNGRPFIIAGHSQGTTHALPLIRELIEGKPLQNQLVAAYLIGMPIPKDYFDQISPCRDSSDTGCIISWRTFKRNYTPTKIPVGDFILVTNPLSWKTDNEFMPKSANLGGVLPKFDDIIPALADAQVHEGILWTTKPHFPFSFLYWRRNYHVADINFYYFNIRQNAINRVNTFMANSSKK